MSTLCAGLDARAANIVMRVVRNIANGRTIVCTIHQPSIAVFEARINSSALLPCMSILSDRAACKQPVMLPIHAGLTQLKTGG